MLKCCQLDCDSHATHRVFWPGERAKVVCEEHCQRAKTIGEAMGFYVHWELISDDDKEAES